MKNNNGITLVALVITIIVLLILAGVSISMVVGQNGVLGQAKNASSKTNVASASTALQLSLTSLQTQFMGDWAEGKADTIYGTFKIKDLDDELQKNGYFLTKYGDVTTSTGEDAKGNVAVEEKEDAENDATAVTIEFAAGKPTGADRSGTKGTIYTASINWSTTGVKLDGEVSSKIVK